LAENTCKKETTERIRISSDFIQPVNKNGRTLLGEGRGSSEPDLEQPAIRRVRPGRFENLMVFSSAATAVDQQRQVS
jgi:hypothetical protein